MQGLLCVYAYMCCIGVFMSLPISVHNHYFATDKDANLRVQDVGGLSLEQCKLVKECAGEGVGEEQRRNRQKGDV